MIPYNRVKTGTMKMKELCSDERPREKMLAKGAAEMSNAELLAILIGSGTTGENVLEVANKLLAKSEGKLKRIAGMDKAQMTDVKGIGPNKYATIAAAMELGRRSELEDPGIRKKAIVNSETVYRLVLPRVRGLDHEECWALFLNRANYLIHEEMISRGGMAGTLVDIKLLVRKALERKATAVIVTHNHPSGNPRPSKGDIELTEQLRKATELMHITLLDHVIVCDDRYYSFTSEDIKVMGESGDIV